jgi:hypothetical protein
LAPAGIVPPTVTAVPTALEAHERVGGHAAPRQSVLVRAVIASYTRPTPIEIPILPSIAWFNPRQMTFNIKPFNPFSIELFAWTPNPDWGGAKVRIPLEDDAMVTDRGVEWLYPVNQRIWLTE